MANELYQGALSMGIILAIGLWIYSSIKKQTVKDTVIELKELWQTTIQPNE